uniref:Uncharacterized protein n=1 Tax=Vespula pensylvanica TaxID=30213 RepID=A0A834U5H0_VESPE|nr:hypothetical protein H0235_011771 [Vespula pensylvanica]
MAIRPKTTQARDQRVRPRQQERRRRCLSTKAVFRRDSRKLTSSFALRPGRCLRAQESSRMIRENEARTFLGHPGPISMPKSNRSMAALNSYDIRYRFSMRRTLSFQAD